MIFAPFPFPSTFSDLPWGCNLYVSRYDTREEHFPIKSDYRRTIKKLGQVIYRFDLIRTCSYESCIIKSFSIYKYEHKKTEEISVSKRKIRWIVKSLEIPYIVIGTLNNQSYLSKILSELGHPWRKKVHAIWRRLRAWWDVDFD